MWRSGPVCNIEHEHEQDFLATHASNATSTSRQLGIVQDNAKASQQQINVSIFLSLSAAQIGPMHCLVLL